MEDAHVVDAFLGFIKPEDSVFASFTDVEQLLILAESQSGGAAQASEG